MKMERDFSNGTRLLNGFLSVMVVVLILILGAVLVTMLLALIGVVERIAFCPVHQKRTMRADSPATKQSRLRTGTVFLLPGKSGSGR